MAGSLWISNAGKRRKGTTFNEIQSLFINQITTKHVYEPLSSSHIGDDAFELLNDLNYLDFDLVGVINDNEEVIGYVNKTQLSKGVSISKIINPIELNSVVTDSTPIYRLIQLLEKRKFVFVMHGNSVEGIVTLADINKPIFRLYIFGIISLFEMHLNYWIKKYYPGNSWENLLGEERTNKAAETFKQRKGNNQALSVIECIQICDKRDILLSTKAFLGEFKFSKSKFERQLSNIEKIRNELAHSQESIISNLNWHDFVSSIKFIEMLLVESELKVEQAPLKTG